MKEVKSVVERMRKNLIDLAAPEFDYADYVVQDLLYRLYKEEAIADGAKNLIRTLADMKKPDLKTAKDVCLCQGSF